MTLDEAIQRENKIAEENQKIVDTQIVFDDVSMSELYCDDTEVIEEHLSNYKKCAEYHDQLAAWLEDLKRRMEYDNELMGSGALKNAYKSGYNKAIDDFANTLKQKYSCLGYIDVLAESDIDEIAEQLKAGDCD